MKHQSAITHAATIKSHETVNREGKLKRNGRNYKHRGILELVFTENGHTTTNIQMNWHSQTELTNKSAPVAED